MKISVCIPCYEYNGFGKECLEYSFSKMESQNFKDFDIIISDHSMDNDIEKLCDNWKNKLDIKYFRNEEKRGNASNNMNNAIRKATGEWIKILCQDDFFMYEDSLYITVKSLDTIQENWLATGYIHTQDRRNYFRYYLPHLNPNIHTVNTVGTPSCISLRNIKPMLEFDENLSYAYDCEYYFRFLKAHGNLKVITPVTIGNYLWENSATSSTSKETIEKENKYILKKHGFINE